MKTSIAQGRYLLRQAEPILAGLEDVHLAMEPQPGTKTAGWLIGHLTISGDSARRFCGQPALCSKEWRSLFNPGTQPSHDPKQYPPMASLCDAFNRVYTDLFDVATTVDPTTLAVENPYAPARAGFPLTVDFVAYMISSHLAYHLGQLAGWRAAAGMGRVARQSAPAG
jgi:hypothetical protein